jgi:hypothetical protein
LILKSREAVSAAVNAVKTSRYHIFGLVSS